MGYFDNLDLDNWFKTITYIGGVIVIISLTIPVQAFSNEIISVFGFGMFLFGTGRWKNMKTKTKFIPGGKLSWKSREIDLIGLILEILDFALILLGVGSLMKENLSL